MGILTVIKKSKAKYNVLQYWNAEQCIEQHIFPEFR